ncbi:MAG: hypothetical protein AB7S78_07245 [Candidatus Omnitrophota bacterium]
MRRLLSAFSSDFLSAAEGFFDDLNIFSVSLNCFLASDRGRVRADPKNTTVLWILYCLSRSLGSTISVSTRMVLAEGLFKKS